MTPTRFANAILRWYDQQGRKDLPWRQQISAYRVWVSEIMLQQTQVQTVIPYFHRFMQHFPTIEQLAHASEDEVLHLWTGLGYYARARHLHRAAQCVYADYQGKFPEDLAALQELPGIGRSTAGAILAIAMQQKAAILDGNVKRVLTRFHAIEGWPGSPENTKQLWMLAERYTPNKRVDDYTQAIMDLGATLCTRARPRCDKCPVNSACAARGLAKENELPHAKPGKKLPIRSLYWLILRNEQGEILLEKRPGLGVWASLWSFPECALEMDVKAWCETHFRCKIAKMQLQSSFRHTFSHFHLEVTPVQLLIRKWPKQVSDSPNQRWHRLDQPIKYGLASPVKRLLLQLMRDENVENCELC
jgi:A/G-specific adenine glycosylase